jgi:energy-coupling factor transporter ATP-binding protein EcfA2
MNQLKSSNVKCLSRGDFRPHASYKRNGKILKKGSPVMIGSIKINGYRGFSDFSMTGLERINLLVGKNNSGKTSILEALSILAGGNDLTALWRILSRRGEQPPIEQIPGRPIHQEVDLSHIFTGHEVKAGTYFTISTTNQKPARTIRYEIENSTSPPNNLFPQISSDDISTGIFALKITTSRGIQLQQVPLLKKSSIRNDIFQAFVNIANSQRTEQNSVQFIMSESLGVQDMLNLWNSIVLTPEEDRIVTALQTLDPDIERVGAVGQPVFFGGTPQRAGFAVKKRGVDSRIPLGSFGEGAWRLFALAAAISRAKDSLLLVDEIDTGLHYTAMESMWKMIDKASKDFNVQVFATTHSYDCVHSLAKICQQKESADSPFVTIQRIEPREVKAVPYDEEEIKMAAEYQIEMR